MIEVAVFIDDTVPLDVPVGTDDIEKHALRVLEGENIGDAAVNIVFVDDRRMIELNETYKRREGTTDVLSFDLSDGAEKLEGEIYVSPVRVRAQSAVYNVDFDREVMRVVTHGLLHLAGHTHDTPEDLERMTAKTDAYLAAYFGSEDT